MGSRGGVNDAVLASGFYLWVLCPKGSWGGFDMAALASGLFLRVFYPKGGSSFVPSVFFSKRSSSLFLGGFPPKGSWGSVDDSELASRFSLGFAPLGKLGQSRCCRACQRVVPRCCVPQGKIFFCSQGFVLQEKIFFVPWGVFHGVFSLLFDLEDRKSVEIKQ